MSLANKILPKKINISNPNNDKLKNTLRVGIVVANEKTVINVDVVCDVTKPNQVVLPRPSMEEERQPQHRQTAGRNCLPIPTQLALVTSSVSLGYLNLPNIAMS